MKQKSKSLITQKTNTGDGKIEGKDNFETLWQSGYRQGYTKGYIAGLHKSSEITRFRNWILLQEKLLRRNAD